MRDRSDPSFSSSTTSTSTSSKYSCCMWVREFERCETPRQAGKTSCLLNAPLGSFLLSHSASHGRVKEDGGKEETSSFLEKKGEEKQEDLSEEKRGSRPGRIVSLKSTSLLQQLPLPPGTKGRRKYVRHVGFFFSLSDAFSPPPLSLSSLSSLFRTRTNALRRHFLGGEQEKKLATGLPPFLV